MVAVSTIASGESLQSVKGYTVSTRTTFHFRDGSIDDDSAALSELKRWAIDAAKRIDPVFRDRIEELLPKLEAASS